MATPKLVEGIDYYMEGDKMVLKAHFLLKRGYCCNSGCRHCPYKDEPVTQPRITLTGLAPGTSPARDPD